MNRPLVSIGMPVYNGEKYLREAIDSLFAQTYQNFEIIVSDDGSTDSTLDIFRSYNDDRIKILENSKRFGMVKNYEHLTKNISGEFFFYADQDDVWLPTFIEDCLREFEGNDQLSSVCVKTESISEDFKEVYFIDPGMKAISNSPVERFIGYRKKLDAGLDIGALCCGIYKTELMRQLPPYDEIIGFDHILIAKAMLLGKFSVVDKVLLKKRSGGASVNKESLQKAHGTEEITHPLRIYSPREKSMQKMIWSSNHLSFFEKMKLSLWSYFDYFRKYEFQLLKQKIKGGA